MAAVKDILMERLKKIENEEFFSSLLLLIDNVDENGAYQFSNEQKRDINESMAQIERGDYLTHEEVMKKVLK